MQLSIYDNFILTIMSIYLKASDEKAFLIEEMFILLFLLPLVLASMLQHLTILFDLLSF